ncbi:low molecular weight protein-tyrosine-phosphatase [Thauera linaloolentis]|uniref:protein-tyrosine-phosphatase n=1 Tax=Thauera linaloolentis (strain DSM 12138 / JCM 21573 / CCUG 41526 / CIP 105981 / IAM 15112 / NBRC 102519 / 47Lol) TaxID=1123367 RepID=N6YX29_THAL4|nr:low molecular weight protein-tyrosine-phosphatase [Thauera linaloolentis]ENO86698.1 protein tyrosine phosphatase [Thauera linaloolentis 47Lol = DSM 12138]MCM8566177.1 low molecular weight phosphotyrosine protein phosphatase [Thauera linaloolentis]
MFEKILILCTGNICRSPLAEALIRDRAHAKGKQILVRSAGIGALVNHAADQTTQQVASQHQVDLDTHRAQQLNLELTRWADLILGMEKHHLDFTNDLDPTTRGKTFLLGHWNKAEVPDPYRKPQEAHQLAYEIISEAVDQWVEKI